MKPRPRPSPEDGTAGSSAAAVRAARRRAAALELRAVSWRNPAAVLEGLTQVDSDRGEHVGGADAVRCGATTLVAGMVLLGAGHTQRAIEALRARGLRLHEAYRAAALPEAAVASDLSGALSHLEDLRRRSARRFTYGDLARLQQDVYVLAIADQRLGADGTYCAEARPSLRTGTLQTYRDLMWGGLRPQMQGRFLDIFWVEDAQSGGHFVLADEVPLPDGSRSVAYDGWPQPDGSAFSRAVDGEGVSIIRRGQARTPRRLRGLRVDAVGQRLPER